VIFFNNHVRAQAPRNALLLDSLIKKRLSEHSLDITGKTPQPVK
jgi:hypothetical protein